jgi:mRNA-degrading endonuclease toxin of MazEF toxin-antitoxin module
VVLVRLAGDKARPAVAVRSDLLSELSYATVLPITTGLRAGVSVRIDLAPSQEKGPRAASQVMVDWPFVKN